MPETERLDRAYHYVQEFIIEQGFAPHYIDVAHKFGLQPEEGKALVHELLRTGIPCWVYPDTDYIASFAPFNNQPTQYRVTVEGETKWFAQCGFEALAITWMFPKRSVRIDAPCLDCGEPLRVEIQDGEIQNEDPAGICAFVDIPFREWRSHPLAYT
jgi:hypothetical protein